LTKEILPGGGISGAAIGKKRSEGWRQGKAEVGGEEGQPADGWSGRLQGGWRESGQIGFGEAEGEHHESETGGLKKIKKSAGMGLKRGKKSPQMEKRNFLKTMAKRGECSTVDLEWSRNNLMEEVKKQTLLGGKKSNGKETPGGEGVAIRGNYPENLQGEREKMIALRLLAGGKRKGGLFGAQSLRTESFKNGVVAT